MDEKTRALRQQLDRVQEEERADLARNLHDDISPQLFSVDVDATMIRHFALNGEGDRVIERADAIRLAVVEMKRQVKAILGLLRPAILVDLGLATALEDLARQWRTRHAGVSINISVPSESLGTKLDATLFHIIRESVSNALRHGKPRTIDINVQRCVSSAVLLEVSDDGSGSDEDRLTRGFGIRGMHERAALIGGTLSIQNRHDSPGLVVLGRFPLPVSAMSSSEAEAKAA
jgi:two-component system sensor histidine kinase UhpB